MNMNSSKQPSDLKNLAQALRAMPVTKPPIGLSEQIMAAMPRCRGWLGRLEYTLGRGCEGVPVQSGKLLLPASPGELGLSFLSAGVFFLCLSAVVLIGLLLSGLGVSLLGAAFSLAPALVGAGLLLLAGFFQLKAPTEIIPQGFRLVVAAVLFGLTMIIGLYSNTQPALDLIASWLGGTGLVVAAAMALISKLSFTNLEVRHAKIVCSS